MSLLASHKDEQKMTVPMGAVLRTLMGAVATVAFFIGIIIDVSYSQMYLSIFVGAAVGWVLSIGVGSSFETIGTAILFNRERTESLTNFERLLVRVLWILGYTFDIVTNFAEMSLLASPHLAGKGAMDYIIAYTVISIASLFLAFCEYIFAISLMFTIANSKVWIGDFWKWLGDAGRKQDANSEYRPSANRLP